MNKLSVYVHVPFCNAKCRYCDFVSFRAEKGVQEEYFAALKKEMLLRREEWEGSEISTVYFGGGTPSSVETRLVTDTLDFMKKNMTIRDDAEITVEANPESADREKLAAFRKAGFNRLSMGLQSANDETLRRIGRIHDSKRFMEAFHDARKAGFENINTDLMIALPEETSEDFRKSLDFVLSLEPEHVSVYSLILEESTPLYEDYEKGLYEENDELDRKMYHEAAECLEKAGYEQYEISNFARKGYLSRHNLYCWDYEEYAGFGLNAASFTGGTRKKNHSVLKEYLSGIESGKPSYEEHEKLDRSGMISEYIMLSLRKTEGLDFDAFKKRFLSDFRDLYGEEIKSCIDDGLALIKENHFRLTKKGLDLANEAMIRFM